ncbi:MAG: carbamoyltransferase HypF, partial [Candidatus Omnitrophica bacterium]|nr:carbamoyltransferase HypF [Candidatus Omnitrophota bacterium]
TTKLLKEGKIVAIKGLGGFHLACDALNDKAVKTLRSRKYREDKPFALMAKDLKTIKQYCEVSPEEEKLLLSWKSPVVILRKSPLSVFSENKGGGKKVSSSVSKHVAPNNKYLGFMLPYTPLHHLLFSPLVTDHSSLSILVMTSGNISDEPIAYNNDEAMKRLKNIADYFLLNDRDIYMRCDDSVTRIFPSTKKEFILRRSRGYTPDSIILRKPNPEIPIDFSEIKPWGQGRKPILAVGGHSKNTFAIAKGDEIILSEHIGDLENVETYNSFVNGIEHFKKLLEVEPKIIAHDLHPDYLSTQYAKNLITVHSPLTTIPIQHHHAHIASVMADNMLDNRKVIGVAFDGTGLGLDLPARLPIGCGQASQQAGGNLWGGEFLIADYVDFKRVAHFKYIPLPGGEKAIKEPWRIAFSYLYSIFGDELWGLNIDFVKKLDKKKSKVLQKMIDNGINTPLTSSIGRLFDAVASLIGVRNTVNYEGQAAIELEMIINDGRRMRDDGRKYKYLINRENGIYIIDMDETIKEIIKDLRNNVSKEIISLKFHNTIVELIVKTCMKIRSDFKENHELRAMSYELNEVALGGGVFQNMFLLTNAYNKLKKAGFRVYIHEKVPTNDGGLSLGQAVIAGYRKI